MEDVGRNYAAENFASYVIISLENGTLLTDEFIEDVLADYFSYLGD